MSSGNHYLLIGRYPVDIEKWSRCLALQKRALAVGFKVHACGTSKKSPVELDVVARGGGHLCPYEVKS